MCSWVYNYMDIIVSLTVFFKYKVIMQSIISAEFNHLSLRPIITTKSRINTRSMTRIPVPLENILN